MPIDGVTEKNKRPPPITQAYRRTEGVPFDHGEQPEVERRYQDEVNDQMRRDLHRVARRSVGDKSKAIWVTSKGPGERILVEHGLRRTPDSFTILQVVGGSYTLYTMSEDFADEKFMEVYSNGPEGARFRVVPD